MLMAERRKLILEEILKHGRASVRELAAEFSVSYETIRKDLTFLEDRGKLVKGHGGALLKEKSIENPFHVRQEKNIDSKQRIAQKAADIIPDGATIILASGSTVLELAKLLTLRKDLKIFTDSLPVAMYMLESDNEVYLFGGKIRKKSSSLYGGWTNSLIQSVKVDMCFIGSDNFELASGPTTPSYSDSSVDKVILNQSEQKYVLADTSKFKGTSIYELTTWNSITALITNKDDDTSTKRLSQKVKIIEA